MKYIKRAFGIIGGIQLLFTIAMVQLNLWRDLSSELEKLRQLKLKLQREKIEEYLTLGKKKV